MAQEGVGISYKLPDGTMLWLQRDNWAEVSEDIVTVFGEDSFHRVNEQLKRAWGGGKPGPAVAAAPALSVVPAPAPAATMTAEQVSAELVREEDPAFETCPKCGVLKDRWVPPGTSTKTGKTYPGFYGCSTPRCPGR